VKAQETQQTRSIFISSALAQKWAMAAGWTAYTASKCGLTGYADACFAELRQCGMKVSVIYPGLVATEMGSEFGGDLGNLLDRRVPIEEFLQPQDVADAVLTLFNPFVGCVTEISLYPQTDLYRMRILTEPKRIEAIISSPSSFVDRRVALITGAGKGIGRGIALQLAREGYNLALIARTDEDLRSCATDCQSLYRENGNTESAILTFPIDVTDKVALADAVDSVVKNFGTLSVVISNAGTNRRKSAALADIKVWSSVVETNLISAMHLTSLTLPHLLRHASRSSLKSSYLIYVNSAYANSRAQTLPGKSNFFSPITLYLFLTQFRCCYIYCYQEWACWVCKDGIGGCAILGSESVFYLSWLGKHRVGN
jgi:NAD(P)-dependent dehydrogenase (short-subunit alcohol dehydrogenase family)